jgi:hypothetical protein
VEYGSQRRIPKASAHWLRERLGAGAVTDPG